MKIVSQYRITDEELATIAEAVNAEEAARAHANAVIAKIKAAYKVPMGWKLNTETREWQNPQPVRGTTMQTPQRSGVLSRHMTSGEPNGATGHQASHSPQPSAAFAKALAGKRKR